MSDLTPLFKPKSVALIGASADPKKYGYWTAKNLVDHKFTGQLYMISRTASGEIFGHKAYHSITDTPGPVDLAVVAIAPKYILPVIQECSDKGVQMMVIVSSGFGETGPEGKALEQEIMSIARKTGMRKLAQSADEAVRLFSTIGAGKAVMKIVSPEILHKTDAGGVVLNVDSEVKAREAYDTLMANAKAYDADAHIFGVMVTPMLAGGVECIIGSSHDVTFGPTVMFGLGGIFVEVLKDVSFRVAPVNEPEASRMIREIKGYPILEGVRGKKGVNIAALTEAISKLSAMVTELKDVAEVDLNPVFASQNGIDIVDARIVLHPVEEM